MASSPSSPYVSTATAAANANGVPQQILWAVIQNESAWNPSQVHFNSNGTIDYGIAQLNDKYYPQAYSMTPQQQISQAAQILAQNYAATGDWTSAVAKYNGSGSAADAYASKVMTTAQNFGYVPAAPSSTSAVTTPVTTSTTTAPPPSFITSGDQVDPNISSAALQAQIAAAMGLPSSAPSNPVDQVTGAVGNAVGGAVDAATTTAKGIQDAISNAVNGAIGNIGTDINNTFAKIWNSIVAYFQANGTNLALVGLAIVAVFAAVWQVMAGGETTVTTAAVHAAARA